jgi:hypothetical protein
MIKRFRVFYFILFLVMGSCELIKEPPTIEALYQKEVEQIDWTYVDELPLVEPCKIFKSRALKQECFFNVINDSIYNKLLRDTSFGLYTQLDTIRLIVTISAQSEIHFKTRFPPGASLYETYKMDSIIQNRLVRFPKVYPAIKRGIPVNTQFEVPLVLLPFKKR